MKKRKPVTLDRESWLILSVVCLGVIATLSVVLFDPAVSPSPDSSSSQKTETKATQVSLANVPLATGKEPIEKLFTQSGCAVCHTIPGIKGAKGREGPKLELGTTARQRLADPNYHGRATTEWEYIQESVLNPGAYVVPGYRDRVMPRWYGKKLSAAALQKIIDYLKGLTERS